MLETIGHGITEFFAYFGRLFLLLAGTVHGIFTGRTEWKPTVNQMARIGVDSLPVAAGSLLVSGAVLAYHGSVQASNFAVGKYAGYLVAEVMAREVSPAIVAFVIAARAGSAMTAEIGTMRVTEQIDALRTMAVSPVHYLVIPRFWGCILMVPAVSFLGILIGVLGGYIMSFMTPALNPVTYFAYIPGHLMGETVLGGVVKALVFGIIIAIVCCHEGLSCGMASEEVGLATTRAVVRSVVLTYVADIIMAPILFAS